MHPSLTTRPICDDDLPFLRQLYGSTRAEEMALVPWSDEQKQQFLDHQFQAQHSHYQQHYGDAEFTLLMFEGRPAGRLYLQRRQDEFRIVDIALLPEFRGQGLGTSILADLFAESRSQRLPVRIHVEFNNPAMRLYERLGFQKIAENGVYHLMERKPD